MAAGKTTPYEEDVHLPLYIRGPGITPGSTIPHLTANVDLAVTFADLAGVNVTNSTAIPTAVDGRSFKNILLSNGAAVAPDSFRQAFLMCVASARRPARPPLAEECLPAARCGRTCAPLNSVRACVKDARSPVVGSAAAQTQPDLPKPPAQTPLPACSEKVVTNAQPNHIPTPFVRFTEGNESADIWKTWRVYPNGGNTKGTITQGRGLPGNQADPFGISVYMCARRAARHSSPSALLC